MALNISRLFKRTPEVAAGDVNGDGTVDARDAAANHGGRPAGIMQDYYAHRNANGHEGDMASHEAVVSGHDGGDESALDAGFSISDDLVNTARTAQGGLGPNSPGGLGVKWEGPDYDASKDSLVTEVGFPKLDGSDKSFTSAEGRSMSFELLKDDGANPGATERSAAPGQGLRDMEIDLGHGGTLNHGDGPDVEALRGIILKQPGSYTATDDLWKFRGEAQDGSGTDNANRTMGSGHAGSGFMMQDGELYPRGIEGAAGPLKWGTPGREASNYASIEFASLQPENGPRDIELRTALRNAPDGSGTDNANRTMGPGHPGSGFMMQDGELYPRGILPFMEAQNFTGSDEQMGQLLGHLQQRGLIDTSTGEVVWAHGIDAQSSSDNEIGALIDWMRANNLIDTSTGEVAWVRQPGGHLPPAAGWAGAGAEANFNADRTAGPGHQGSGFMMQDGELYPRARSFDSDDPQATSGAGNAQSDDDGPDTGAIRDITAKRGGSYTATDDLWKFRGENTGANAREAGSGMASGRRQYEPLHADGVSSQHGGMETTGESPEFDEADALFGRVRQDTPGGMAARDLEGQMGGVHVRADGPGAEAFQALPELDANGNAGSAGFLPEVNDEVLVSFSALEADADAPTTLVDLHSHGATAEGLVGHVEIPHLDPGHHGHGFMDYTDDAAIDN